MFHCNGWCTTWALTAVAGTHVCLRAVRADDIWRLIDQAGVTHMAGAPTVLSMMRESPLAHPLSAAVDRHHRRGAAEPVDHRALRRAERAGRARLRADRDLRRRTRCARTRTPGRRCRPAERSRLRPRQGVGMITADDGESRCHALATRTELVDVPADGVTMGEIVMRGNTVMKEYFRDPERDRGRRSAAAGSTPATSGCATPTATSSCWTGPRTSSSPAARTSPPSRWRTR